MGRRTVAGTVALALLAGAPVAAQHTIFTNNETRFYVERAVAGAADRLRSPDCLRVLDEFQDGSGRPLRLVLDTIGTSSAGFVEQLRFVEGGAERPCRDKLDLEAFTTPGHRVVFVCGSRFSTHFRQQSAAAQVLVNHEALHALGLAENPPSSAYISERVWKRCGA
jgi:hypothetical protein